MDPLLLVKGVVLGFSIAAPVGPIGVLCIRRTLADGRAVGFVSGLGAATADTFYGGVAAFGLTAISGLLTQQQGIIRLVGGLFLLYLGLRTLLAKPATQAASVRRGGLLAAYGSTVFLTLTNPTTILSFIAIFAGLGVASGAGGFGSAGLLVLGVFCGSALWWLILSSGVSLVRARITPRVLRWVNVVSATLLVGFGILALMSLRP
jgi:threonine/homoserine/homoserine lactone efflux protein